MNLTIRANAPQNGEGNIIFNSQKTEQQEGRKSFFAGNTKLADDPIAQKRKEAQEKAWKVVKQAWESDKAVDRNVQARKDHYAEMETLRAESVKELSGIREAEAALKEACGVSEDSEEQQDLELLKKRQDILGRVTNEKLSQEEMARLAEIDKKGLTEYQKRALELNDVAGTLRKEINEYNRQMEDDVSDIKRIAIERLKSNPMVEAEKAAEDIKEAYNDEIIGMLMQESKEHIEEKLEEAEEAAKEKAEEKEKEEEQLEDIRELKALQEAVIEGTKEAIERAEAKRRQNEASDIELTDMIELAKPQQQTDEVKQSLNEIKNSMNLLEADLKGIKVDEEV